MNLPNNDDLHLLAGSYALNALDDVERRRFESHLTSCTTCQDDIAGFRLAVDELAVATSQAPPPAMKARVLAEVGRTRQVSTVPARSMSVGRALPRLALAAAVVAALGMGGLAAQQRERADRYQEAASLATAPDARIVRLAGRTGAAQMIYSPTTGSGVLVADNLAPAPSGRTYQLWIIEAGTPRPIGTFDTNSAHHGELRVTSLPGSGSLVAVTEEPDGGSQLPTTAPLLASDPV